MTNQQELVRQVTGKNRLSNIMLCCKIVFDLIPQVLLIHMIGLYFAAALTREQILWECDAMLICFIGKAVCAYSATWTAHKAAYTCLTDLRLQIIWHLKKLSLGFFQERKTGDLTNVVQHDVEQVEGHLAMACLKSCPLPSFGRRFSRYVVGGLASGSRNNRGASADVDHEKSLCPALDKEL